jgi:hypothetical protein
LHSALRKWVTARLDDIRLTRLYFNEEGRLALICDMPAGDDKDLALVEAELKAQLGTFRLPQPVSRPPIQEPIVKTGPDTFKGSLTKHLQTLVTDPKNSKWIEVLIERGFFNDKNQYVVRGVVESEEQKKQLTEYIDSLKSDPEWSAYFKFPVAPTELDVIPMAAMVARVQRVTPAYPVFDGVRIMGAKYVYITDDKSGFAGGLNLVFTAHAVGKPNLYECRVLLADLISKHPSYSRRLAKSSNPRFPKLRIQDVPEQQVSSQAQMASFANGYGASYLARAQSASFFERLYNLVQAKEWINEGLLYNPDHSSIWFLNAYFHFTAGDMELTKRDLYRAIAIEEPLGFDGGDQRRRRYDVAKDLQGEKRDALEKLWLECWKEVKNGAKPMTMVPAK